MAIVYTKPGDKAIIIKKNATERNRSEVGTFISGKGGISYEDASGRITTIKRTSVGEVIPYESKNVAGEETRAGKCYASGNW